MLFHIFLLFAIVIAQQDYCSERWEQCGGKNWDGPTCCVEGCVCEIKHEYYSQCMPDCGKEWDQCGGKDWDGHTCCEDGLECQVLNDYYHQCRKPYNFRKN